MPTTASSLLPDVMPKTGNTKSVSVAQHAVHFPRTNTQACSFGEAFAVNSVHEQKRFSAEQLQLLESKSRTSCGGSLGTNPVPTAISDEDAVAGLVLIALLCLRSNLTPHNTVGGNAHAVTRLLHVLVVAGGQMTPFCVDVALNCALDVELPLCRFTPVTVPDFVGISRNL